MNVEANNQLIILYSVKDVFGYMGRFLSIQDIAQSMLVCKAWKTIFGNENEFWLPHGLKVCDRDVVLGKIYDNNHYCKKGVVHEICRKAILNYDFDKVDRCTKLLSFGQTAAITDLIERQQKRESEIELESSPPKSKRRLEF